MAGRLRVTLVRSPISHTARTRGTVRALGLHRLGETVELPDAPHTRGMIRAVRFLVEAEEVAAEPTAGEPEEVAAEPQEAAAPARARRANRKKEESES